MVIREEIPKRRESEHASVPLLFGAGIYKGAARASLYASSVVHFGASRVVPPRLCARHIRRFMPPPYGSRHLREEKTEPVLP